MKEETKEKDKNKKKTTKSSSKKGTTKKASQSKTNKKVEPKKTSKASNKTQTNKKKSVNSKTSSNKAKTNNKKKTTKKSNSKKNLSFFGKFKNIVLDFLKKDKNKLIWMLVIETLYIFAVEVVTKLLLNTFSVSYPILRIFISSIVLSIIITLITSNINLKVRKVIYIVINFFIAFYAWLQIGFMNFLGAFMSMGNAEQGTKITDYIVDFVKAYKPVVYTIFIPFVLVLVYLIFEKKFTNKGYLEKIKYTKKKVLIIIGSIVLLCGMFYATVVIPFMQNKFQTVSNKDLLKYPSNPSIAIKNYGTTVYFLLDLKGSIFGGADEIYGASGTSKRAFQSATREIDDSKYNELIKTETDETLNKLNNYFINREIPDTNEYTGKFKDKNLIMIMMETVSYAVFDDAYKEYFPTLNKMYHEGITGVNNYSPKNNCATGESEMTSEISLYSIETTCTVNTYKKNVYREALLYMMRNNGYYASAYHNYSDHYYYRNTFEYNFGAEKFYDVDALGIDYVPVYKEWPSDVELMEKALPNFIDKDKFASYMVTVTSHTPYIQSSTYGDMYVDMFDDLDIDLPAKRYLSKIKVVDLAMEYLLKELEEQGKLEDTVIVLFGDHYPYALSRDEFQSIAKYDINTNQEMDRTPFIIYNKGTEHEKIYKVTTPMDYAPTLLNLFGINYDPRYYMGHDIFSNYDDYAVFPDNSWQSAEGFYSAAKGEFLPRESGYDLDDEKIIARNEEITQMRNMSALAIRNDYFNYLFDYFENYGNNNVVVERTD